MIALSPETEEMLESYRDAWLAAKGIRSAGEALKGALSHPVGYLGIATLIAGLTIALSMPTHFDRVRARDEAAGMAGVVPYPDEMAENVGENVNRIVKAAEAIWNWLRAGGLSPTIP